jgi:hypothetical protein
MEVFFLFIRYIYIYLFMQGNSRFSKLFLQELLPRHLPHVKKIDAVNVSGLLFGACKKLNFGAYHKMTEV